MFLVIQFGTSFHGVEDKYFLLAYDAVYTDEYRLVEKNEDGSSSAAVLRITEQAYRNVWLPPRIHHPPAI
jgi:hypothetical protein